MKISRILWDEWSIYFEFFLSKYEMISLNSTSRGVGTTWYHNWPSNRINEFSGLWK